jgi:RNA polymerase sigma factor (sigma-70 family)
MRDSEVVAAIVAGDPDGLAEAYDRYAAPLYSYCRALLREPADAADAVQDTFVIAASKLAGLRDPNRLRPWLYAVARNECHGRLRAGVAQVPTELDELLDVTDTDTTAEVSGEAERDELRTLVRSAAGGLNAGEQDLIELQLRQGLDVAEIAAVLGVSRNHAHALLSRARGQLETSLGALLVARSGRADCDGLDAMLADWDGQLTPLMRKRINRHIEQCRACKACKKRELSPALLLGAAPLAAALPAELRKKTLRVARSYVPAAAAYRAKVTRRTATFRHQGFPKPMDRPKTPWWRPPARRAAATAGGVAAVAAAGALVAMTLTAGSAGPHGGASALGPDGGPGIAGTIGGAAAGGGSAGSGPQAGNRGAANGFGGFSPSPAADGVTVPGLGGTGGAPRAGSASGYWLAGGSGGSADGAGGTAGNASAVGGSGPGGSGPGGSGAGSGGSGSGGSGSSGSGGSGGGGSSAASGGGAKTTPGSGSSGAGGTSSSAPATKTSSAAPPPAPGTLSVSPSSLVLSLGGSGSFTLTASGGPVNWSVSESSGLVGNLTVSPSSGTLAAGQSTTISVSAGLLTLDGSLTVEPGGTTVSVVIGTDL